MGCTRSFIPILVVHPQQQEVIRVFQKQFRIRVYIVRYVLIHIFISVGYHTESFDISFEKTNDRNYFFFGVSIAISITR